MHTPFSSPTLSALLPRELIVREKLLMQKEWMRQSTRVRFVIIGLCLVIGAVDFFVDVLPSPWQVWVGLNAFAGVANAMVLRQHARDAVRPWYVWALLASDTLIIAFLTAALGTVGYFGLPFFLVASASYSLNIPRAARIQLAAALTCYPTARAVGLFTQTGQVPVALLLIEALCLGTLGYFAISGPIRFTYRVRGARRALGALAQGDFGVRLPARALDDLGFLAVSFNDTAERLGRTVRALEGEIAERGKAEQELLASREALAHQAFHDPLTGLPNRSRFREKLAEAIACEGTRCTAVLAVDLDGFKTVNDTFGHAAGDALLVEVARRLLSATRGTDVVTRVGGDEFGVLLPFLADEKEAALVAERILTLLAVPVTLGDRTTAIGASIGIALHAGGRGALEPSPAPEDWGGRAADERQPADPVDHLLYDADVALYHAKASGKGRWSKFDPSMHDAATERRLLQSELRRALARDELELYYQPIISLRNDQANRVEALVRWRHPTRGLVTPGTFIPLAEDSGLILPLGRWVLATACRQLAAWQRTFGSRGGYPPLAMSVNVSGRQLQHPGFVDEVRQVLRETGVDPATVILELTESAVIHQRDAARERMHALKGVGVRLAIDDFGTGYSSLSYLQHFPIDVLKVDRSFVDGVTRGGPEAAVVRTIVELGKALALETVAEGIETPEQRRCVEDMGCDAGQGYLFAVPMDVVTAEAWLAARRLAAGSDEAHTTTLDLARA